MVRAVCGRPGGVEAYVGPDTIVERDHGYLPRWLQVIGPQHHSDVVIVRPIGGTVGNRTLDLWSALENAIEQAAGALVIADLTRVTAFDRYTVRTLSCVATAAVRWHHDFCVVAAASSALAQYVRWCGQGHVLGVYSSVIEAVASFDNEPLHRTASPLN